ncbi:BRO family protein [Geomicrobium sp. JCM 19055]|uniref:BRO-N domain-containing protein n=1 Tax=Geomicrobium sp. JCM 19055 TaxID=1460649 RepID=UPI00045ED970|nr:BRO family protein [Geomicrobium sp. JCM 19055]GAK01475.1 phage antirepressor protein [Geomicrobium sp. JCM 19055]
MNQLTKMFEGNELTMINRDDEVIFLLNDVCSILGIGNSRHVRARLEDDVVSNYPIQDSLGRTQQATFINEDGLYDVILDSRKPEAKVFRKWITSEVIPSIRKTGGYQVQQHPTSQLEILQGAINQMVEQDRKLQEQSLRITTVENKLTHTSEVLSLNQVGWREKATKLLNKIALQRGGYKAYADVRKESYQLLEGRAKCSLSTRLTNKQRKMAHEGVAKSKIDKVNNMDVIADDARLMEIYLAVVKEMAIKHEVEAS